MPPVAGSLTAAGVQEISGDEAWDGLDDRGGRCCSGLYYVRMVVDGRISATRPVVLPARR